MLIKEKCINCRKILEEDSKIKFCSDGCERNYELRMIRKCLSNILNLLDDWANNRL